MKQPRRFLGEPPLGQYRWDRFETFVLRLGRANYIVLALLGALGVVAGLGFIAAGLLVHAPAKPAPLPPVAPATEPMTLPAVEQTLTQHPEYARFDKLDLEDDGTRPPPVTAAIRALFPEPPYAWDDVFEEVCKVPTSYGCLERGRRLARRGVSRIVQRALAEAPEDLSATVVAMLGSAPVERRGPLLLATVATYWASKDKQRDAAARRQREADEAEAKHNEAVEGAQEKKHDLMMGGAYAGAAGLSTMILASLFLALLAIERHVRILRLASEAASRDLGGY
jgi:hypothetical protein